MALSPELDALVSELAQRHPGFRRVTIGRLVARTALDHSRLDHGSLDHGGRPAEALLVAVRRQAEDQLRYVEETPETTAMCQARPARGRRQPRS